MNTISKARMQTIILLRYGARLLLAVLFAGALGSSSPLLAQASPANSPYPDVQEMIREQRDNVTNGTALAVGMGCATACAEISTKATPAASTTRHASPVEKP